MRGGSHPTEAISAYLDGELPAAERASVEEHLRGCAACAALRAGLERLAAASRDEEVPPVPADLAARVAAALDGDAAAARREERLPLRRLRAPLAAAAMLAVAAALWIVFQRSPEEISRQILTPESAGAPPATEIREQPSPGAAAERGAGDDAEGKRAPAALGESAAAERSEPAGEADAIAESKSKAPEKESARGVGTVAEQDAAPTPARRERFAPAPPADERQALRTDTAESGFARAAEPADGEKEAAGSGEPAPSALPGRAGAPVRFAQAPATRLQVGSEAALSSAPEERMAGGRALLLSSAAYQIRLTEAGGLMLRAEDYECTVPAAPQEVTELLARAGRAEEASGDRTTAGEGAAAPWTLRRQQPDGTSVVLAGDEADAIAARLRELVRGPHAPALIEACGPLPAPLGARH